MSGPGDPRNGHRYRTAVALAIAHWGGICHLCGHGGARTGDHVISVKEWFRRFGTYDGVNALANLRPAHGNRGRYEPNPCPVCGKLCNQARGAKSTAAVRGPQPRSRDW